MEVDGSVVNEPSIQRQPVDHRIRWPSQPILIAVFRNR